MKIKKLFQGTIPENKILNTESTSQTDTYSCDYINNTSIVVSSTEPTGDNRKGIWFKKGENLFDKNTMIELNNQFRYYNDGTIGTVDGFNGLKIPVMPNTKYNSSGDNGSSNLAFWDKNMNYLSGLIYNTSDKKFTTPNDCEYVTIAVQSKNIDTFKFEIQQEIYVMNSNGLYEKFM